MPAPLRPRLKNQVSPYARTAGNALARWGHVALLHVSRHTVVAQIRNKEIVEIRVRNDKVEVACSCPLHELGLVCCRHVWATLTAIERTGALGFGRNTRDDATSFQLRATMERPSWPSRARALPSASTSSRPPRRGSRGGSG